MGKRSKIKKIISPPSSVPPPEEFGDDDSDLMEELMTQLDSRDRTVQSESAAVLNEMSLKKQADAIDSAPKQDAKSRFKARQARKAAALASSLAPNDTENDARLAKEAKDEEHDIAKVCRDLDLSLHEVNPDGHCLFSAVADQLTLLSIIPPEQANYATMRQAASDYMASHPDEFLPFLPSSEGEDGTGAESAGVMSPQEFTRYCSTIRNTAMWGGEPEILALSRAYNVPIHVVQSGSPPIVKHSPDGSETDAKDPRVVRISYHRRMYGLGEHYNSLRPEKRGLSAVIPSLFKS